MDTRDPISVESLDIKRFIENTTVWNKHLIYWYYIQQMSLRDIEALVGISKSDLALQIKELDDAIQSYW